MCGSASVSVQRECGRVVVRFRLDCFFFFLPAGASYVDVSKRKRDVRTYVDVSRCKGNVSIVRAT